VKIGFIGLGAMGLPMSLVLRKAGHHVVGFTRTPSRVADAGVTDFAIASTAAAAAENSEVVITMLPDGPDVETVVGGPEGLLSATRRRRLWIDMSTIAPSTARTLANLATEAGYRCLDAPVSGGISGAQNGSLSIMVGGPLDVFAEARPMLETLGSRVVRIGDSGAGQVAKACNQMIVAASLLSVAEALVLGQRAGVDAAKIREALLGGFASSRVLEVHGKRMLEHDFAPGFRLRLHQKDLGIAVRLGAEVGASVMMATVAGSIMNAAAAHGLGDADHSAIAIIIESLAATQLEPLEA